MNQAIFLLRVAVIVFVVAIVFRAMGYNDLQGIPPLGVTPGALHRVVNTLLLGSIALALVQIHRVLHNAQGGTESSGGGDKSES